MCGIFKIYSLVVMLSNGYQNNYWPLSKTQNVFSYVCVPDVHLVHRHRKTHSPIYVCTQRQ